MNGNAPEKKLKRAMTVNNILTKKRKILHFDGAWKECIGMPELAGSWIIWGGSGSGKTTACMQLAKYLTRFGRVLYDSMEEGDSQTIKRAFIRVGMKDVGNRFLVVDDPIEDLAIRLRQHKAPRIVFIDSVQYTGMTYRDYRAFVDEFSDRLLIWVSHEEGKLPEGKTANRIRYNSHVKMRSEGYRLFVISRFKDGGESHYDIWPEAAQNFHGN